MNVQEVMLLTVANGEETVDVLTIELITDDLPSLDEIPTKYLTQAIDQIEKNLALAKRSRQPDLVEKWERFKADPRRLAANMWYLENPNAKRWKSPEMTKEIYDVLRIYPLDVESFDVGYTQEEKDYMTKRREVYMNDYGDKEFNKSSDAMLLRITLDIELSLLQQMVLMRYDIEGKEKVLDRVSKLTDELRKMHDALRALRKQRIAPAPKPPPPKVEKVEQQEPEEFDVVASIDKQFEVDPERVERIQAEFDERKEQFEREREKRLKAREPDVGDIDEYEEENFEEEEI